jgi:hypothetical protein
MMTTPDPQIRINAITVTQIVNDTMKEYSNDYARMRSHEIIAAREGISANEFTLFPLEKGERDIIYNEKENDKRRKSWLNEARARVIQYRHQQGEPYDLSQQNEWRLDFTLDQQRPGTEPPREMEQCDAIRLEHLPAHLQEDAAENFSILYKTIASTGQRNLHLRTSLHPHSTTQAAPSGTSNLKEQPKRKR